MSHFTVLVPAKDEEELEAKLLPYHEYECTGIEAYLQFVPGDVEEMQTEFKEHGEESQTFDEFVKDWYGYDKNEAGIWGRTTNPNKQWDWWVIGGRWSNLLKKVNGKKADYAQAGNVDWKSLKQNNISTWAFIDLEGKWNQRGEMGWFGLHSNEEPDYDKVFWQFVQSLPADQMVYVVDCHI